MTFFCKNEIDNQLDSIFTQRNCGFPHAKQTKFKTNAFILSSDYYNILLKKPKNSNGNSAIILYHTITKTMQAKLPLHKKLFFRLPLHTIGVLLLLVANLSFSNVTAQATVIWVGSGTLNGSNTLLGQSFNNPLNWDLSKVPTSNDNDNTLYYFWRY